MAYKDKDKQREAQRDWVRQKRATKGSTEQGSTEGSIPIKVMAEVDAACGDKLGHGLKRGLAIKCFADLPMDVKQTIIKMSDGDKDEKAKRTVAAIRYQHLFPDRYDNRGMPAELIAVTGKPGDADYNGICTPEWRAERGR